MSTYYVPQRVMASSDIAWRLAEMLANAYLAKVTITIDEGHHGRHTVEVNKLIEPQK